MSTSRPVSLAPSTASRMPSLQEILTDSAPQPYTLGAFMAYLSQNHCLETLEFTMEADRYRLAHSQALHNMLDNSEHVCELWQKLLQAYIQPYGTREVNLPGPVRDRLLRLHCGTSPPHPSELDEAVRIVYELMSDSVLVPFLASFSPAPTDFHVEEPAQESSRTSRHGRSRTRSSKELLSPKEGSPKTSFLPQLHISRRSEGKGEGNSRSGSSSAELGEREDLTDDSGSNSPPILEPMTPPTTPPTADWTFTNPTSPGTLHRAISAHSNSWKRVGAKLGIGRKGHRSGARGSSTSAGKIDTALNVNESTSGHQASHSV